MIGVDLGEVKTLGAGQGEREDARAADHADLADAVLAGRVAADADGLLEGRADQGALGGELRVAGYDQVQAAGQGPQLQAVPGLAAHQAGLADGVGLELLKV